MTSVILKSFPMPISVNKSYRNLSFKGRPGRVKTKYYLEFQRQASLWAMANTANILEARALAKKLGSGYVFKVNYFFWFHKDTILMKNPGLTKRRGDPKANDSENRLKPLSDVLFAILGVDDCWLWSGSFDKGVLKDQNMSECVDIEIKLVQLFTEVGINGSPNLHPLLSK